MGLEKLKQPEQLDPIKVPQAEKHIDEYGRYVVTKTYHGSVYEGRDHPKYIRFNLIDNEFEDRIIKKQSRIISGNDQYYMKLKGEIIHSAQVMNGIVENYLEK